MVKLEGRWNLVSSYVRATYKVLDKETGKEYSVKGNVIGQKVLSIFGDEVVFEEGEYIKRLTAKYEPVTGATSNFHVTTSLGRKFWLIRVQLVSFTKIELKDVACLTGHRGILCCGGLGAWSGERISSLVHQLSQLKDSIGRHGKTRLPTKLYDFDSKEIVRTEDKEDNYAILSHSVEKEGDIDKSIEKAGKVCEDLKSIKSKDLIINYLWVDSKCIDKNNSEEIKQEMRKMSGYYSNSTFTLIAINDKLGKELSIDNKDDRKQIIRKIVDSRWFSRAWTFQEGLLSKHTIFMFDDDTIDGASLAQDWESFDNSLSVSGLIKNKGQTPIGWISESSHQSNKTSFVIELEKALEMVTKERKVTVAKDIFYSVLGLFPTEIERNINFKYKPRLCGGCKVERGIDREDYLCSHDEKYKDHDPHYSWEELKKCLEEILGICEDYGYNFEEEKKEKCYDAIKEWLNKTEGKYKDNRKENISRLEEKFEEKPLEEISQLIAQIEIPTEK